MGKGCLVLMFCHVMLVPYHGRESIGLDSNGGGDFEVSGSLVVPLSKRREGGRHCDSLRYALCFVYNNFKSLDSPEWSPHHRLAFSEKKQRC